MTASSRRPRPRSKVARIAGNGYYPGWHRFSDTATQTEGGSSTITWDANETVAQTNPDGTGVSAPTTSTETGSDTIGSQLTASLAANGQVAQSSTASETGNDNSSDPTVGNTAWQASPLDASATVVAFAQDAGSSAAAGAAAASQRDGHHWVPQSVARDLSDLLDVKAAAIFKSATTDPMVYDHGFDTWNDTTHAAYNKSVANLLQGFRNVVAPGGKLDETQAQQFVALIQQGNTGALGPKFLADHADDLSKITGWRTGFLHSVTVANGFLGEAAKNGINLTKTDLKTMTQNWINGGNKAMSQNAKTVFDSMKFQVGAMTPGSRLLWFKTLRIGAALSVLGVALDAKRGFAGDGKFAIGGISGAALEAADKALESMVFKDQVEAFIFPPVLGGMAEAAKLIPPAPSLDRRALRHGVTPRR